MAIDDPSTEKQHIFLPISIYTNINKLLMVAHWKCLNETLSVSTHNTIFEK